MGRRNVWAITSVEKWKKKNTCILASGLALPLLSEKEDRRRFECECCPW